MKIAIMTQPLGKNYGGIMQAWALQQILKRMAHEVVTIDRQPRNKSPLHIIARLGYRAAMKAIGKRKAPINLEKHLPYILKNTREFIEQHIAMSEPLYNTESLKAHFEREQYDAVIVGSDQTWRPQYSPNISNFFLDFLEGKDIKRIAYASSFGVDQWEFTEQQTKLCAELAKHFSAISVREDSGVRLCNKHLGVEAIQVLDPTLLLEKHDYLALIGKELLCENPQGVYTYFLDKTPKKAALAQKAEEQLGEKVYSCQAKNNFRPDVSSDLNDFKMPDICDWLAGFANAKFVLTDSFHGVIFSIIFNKPFLALKNDIRGASRFISFLSLIDFEEALVDSERSDFDFNAFAQESFSNSKKHFRLFDLKKESLHFIGSSFDI